MRRCQASCSARSASARTAGSSGPKITGGRAGTSANVFSESGFESDPPNHRLTSPGFSGWAGSAASATGAAPPAARADSPQAAERCM